MLESIIIEVAGVAIPAIISSIIAYLWARVKSYEKSEREYKQKLEDDMAIMKKAMQTYLRDRLVQGYNHYYCDLGRINLSSKQSFDKCYQTYHELGRNGVMDDIYTKVMSLEVIPDEECRKGGRCAIK